MTTPRRRRLGVPAVLALGATTLAMPGDAQAAKARTGTITAASAHSAALGEDIAYNVYLPYGYQQGARRYPVLYLLHGRGDTMQAWTQVKDSLDDMIQRKIMPPVIAVMPDAPWSQRGNWYVDSAYTGADDPGRPVETALTRDLVRAVDATYRTAAIREARLIGGYSMGGAGALRFALAHQDLFGSALVLSSAIYTPIPPADSSTRSFGAFGIGDQKFDDAVYQGLNTAPPAGLPAPVYGTAGTDWAGGVAGGADGSVSLGYAVSGPVDGQPHASGLDAVVTRLGADHTRRWTRQLGTAEDERLYGVATASGTVLVSGLTYGTPAGAGVPGNGDVFLATIDPAKGLP
jgi:poly(3-hydroxybutyrate) depolymerase